MNQGDTPLEKVIISNQKSDLSLELTLEDSNKILDLQGRLSQLKKMMVIKYLAPIKTKEVKRFIYSNANDNNWKIRLQVAKALKGHSSAKGIKVLKKLIKDNDSDIRNAATNSL